MIGFNKFTFVHHLKQNKLKLENSITDAFEPSTPVTSYSYPPLEEKVYGPRVWCLVVGLNEMPVEYHSYQKHEIEPGIFVSRKYCRTENPRYYGGAYETIGGDIYIYTTDPQKLADFILINALKVELNDYQKGLQAIFDSMEYR